jgi:uncharacterized protein YndB with AHSA1/START domain
MKQIIHVVDIAAPRKKVYDAIATREGLARWWSTKVEGGEEKGSTIRFTFLGDFNPQMLVTRLEEPNAVSWTCTGGHANWQDNTFSFELRESNKGTSLRFTQTYARELDLDVYGTYNFNWGYYLDSLTMLLERGMGKPFKS